MPAMQTPVMDAPAALPRPDLFAATERAGWRLVFLARSGAIGAAALFYGVTQAWGPPLYYIMGVLALLFLLGGVELLVARSERAPWWLKYAVVALNISLLAWLIFQPNPFRDLAHPPAFYLREAEFEYLLVAVSLAALTLSPPMVAWFGMAAIASWCAITIWVLTRPGTISALNAEIGAGVPRDKELSLLLSPHFVNLTREAGQLMVAAVIAGIVAAAVWRSRRLARDYAQAERDRSSLARYFSPNMVDELAHIENPFGPVRRQEIGVLFVDIVGFTAYSEAHAPEQVIDLLREFHRRMADIVFANGGTVDNYIGDCLMATFGVPRTTGREAAIALHCARDMLDSLRDWNQTRIAAGEAPIDARIGLHFGPVVMGTIGSERALSFAVIGDTPNVANRLQRLTRSLDAAIAISQDVVEVAHLQPGVDDRELLGFVDRGEQEIRGREHTVHVWTLAAVS
jgi:adenylate cyclase